MAEASGSLACGGVRLGAIASARRASVPGNAGRDPFDARGLRSIGSDPATADDQFVGRCQAALDVVQRDLDATGFGQYRIRARLGQGWPAMVYPALDGTYWGGAEGMKRETSGAWLLFHAAELASDTLREVSEVEWPLCATHGGDPMTPDWVGEDRVTLIDEVVWWQCSRPGHALAPVGQLTAKVAKTL